MNTGSMALSSTHRHTQQKENDQKVIHFVKKQPSFFGPSNDTAADSFNNSTTRAVMANWPIMHSVFRRCLKKCLKYWKVKALQLLCVVYILVLTFSYPPVGIKDRETGFIVDPANEDNTQHGVLLVNGDHRAVVASTHFQMVCLAISRMSAFSLYPVMILVFFSKCKATNSFLKRTPCIMYTVDDMHALHSYAGRYISFDVWIHALFHLLRWQSQGNLDLLWKTRTGLSGLIVVIFVPAITLLMMYGKGMICYEIRKGLHYLFYGFAIGLCFHVPISALPNGGFIAPVMGFVICYYTLDSIYVNLFMTEKIEAPSFDVLKSGTQMTINVSSSFRNRMPHGGYAYVCLPWIDKHQWHAFSLFESPASVNERRVFMQSRGDWTKAVHDSLQRNTRRPVWIQGPFPSPYDSAIEYDNQILVASGIGITCALSAMRALNGSRNISLVWSVREVEMLEFFLGHFVELKGWNLVFYTGSEPLNTETEEQNRNVTIIRKRANLRHIIPNIIHGIEAKEEHPKQVPSCKEKAKTMEAIVTKLAQLDRSASSITAFEKLTELTIIATHHGFEIDLLVDEMIMTGNERSSNSLSYAGANWSTRSTEQPSSTCGDYSIEGRVGSNSTLDLIREYGRQQLHPEWCNDGTYSVATFAGTKSQMVIIRDLLQDIELRDRRLFFVGSEVVDLVVSRGHAQTRMEALDLVRRIASDHDLFDAISKDSSHVFEDSNCFYRFKFTNVKRFVETHTGQKWRHITSSIQSKTSPFRPWEEDAHAKEYVKGLDKRQILSTWGILYCGGSHAIMNVLKGLSHEYDIALRLESLDW